MVRFEARHLPANSKLLASRSINLHFAHQRARRFDKLNVCHFESVAKAV